MASGKLQNFNKLIFLNDAVRGIKICLVATVTISYRVRVHSLELIAWQASSLHYNPNDEQMAKTNVTRAVVSSLSHMRQHFGVRGRIVGFLFSKHLAPTPDTAPREQDRLSLSQYPYQLFRCRSMQRASGLGECRKGNEKNH